MKHHPSQSEERDELLTVLSHSHCRDVLSYLRDSPGEVTSVDDLASGISERDGGDAGLLSRQLYHSTLPRLAEAGVIDYNTQDNTVRYRDRPDLEALLDDISDSSPPE